MLNLHAAVRGVIQLVNGDISVIWQASTGYTANGDGSRTPRYAAPVTVSAQVQPLSTGDLRHVEFLNLQGDFRAVYLYPNAEGVVRPSQQGGDLITFPQIPGGPPQVWLTVRADETWGGPGWFKVLVCLQGSS